MARILVIEDEEYIRDLYKRQLALAGFTTDTASNGEEAAQVLTKNTYDLILLDIMMPGIDGLSLLEKIKKDEKTKDTKVVILTNLGQQDIIKEAFGLGTLDYIIKIKNTPDQIVEKVKGYLV